jgi:hypothetical protein
VIANVDATAASGLENATPTTTAATVETPWLSEAEAVRRWRLQELEHAGYGFYDAAVLAARADVDLRVAVALLRDGCPVGTALRILL